VSSRRGRAATARRRAATTAAPPNAAVDRRRVRAIHRRLEKRFGRLEPSRRTDPLEELILTVLSQNTSDVNSSRAFNSLRARYPSWRDLARARVSAVVDAIRAGGLANVKAPRLLSILREIGEPYDLSWMHEASDEDVRGYLLALPGVGPKTAACVLAFSLDRDAIPVDTHVHRTASRLGLLPAKATADAAHRMLEDAVPKGLRVQMHVGLIRLGREICRPGRPRCEDCPLIDLCPTAPLYLGSERATRVG
jgi:endonuclease III